METGRPRPVELEIPPDTLANSGNVHIIEREEYPATMADSDNIAKAAQILLEAQSPAIIAGGGSMISGAGAELLQVAEMAQAPIMTTQNSKGVIPETNFYKWCKIIQKKMDPSNKIPACK